MFNPSRSSWNFKLAPIWLQLISIFLLHKELLVFSIFVVPNHVDFMVSGRQYL